MNLVDVMVEFLRVSAAAFLFLLCIGLAYAGMEFVVSIVASLSCR